MDIRKRRRQAAWLCFETFLSEEQRLQSVQILEREFQIDGAVNLMAYVAKICMEFGINLQYHNKLYEQLCKLVSESVELLTPDPLTLIQFDSLSIEQLKEQKVQVLKQETVTAAPVAEKTPSVQTEKPAYIVIFVTFIAYIFERCPDKLELFTVLFDLVTDSKSKAEHLAQPISKWINEPNNYTWANNLNQAALTDLVHLIYTALCEMLGPVVADDCFHKAIAVCEQTPEARIFSPTQFL